MIIYKDISLLMKSTVVEKVHNCEAHWGLSTLMVSCTLTTTANRKKFFQQLTYIGTQLQIFSLIVRLKMLAKSLCYQSAGLLLIVRLEMFLRNAVTKIQQIFYRSKCSIKSFLTSITPISLCSVSNNIEASTVARSIFPHTVVCE